MINRENLQYIENILSLQNTDVKLKTVYDILTSIKEGDNVRLFDHLLELVNKDITNTQEIKEILIPLLHAIKEGDNVRLFDHLLELVNKDITNTQEIKEILIPLLHAIKEGDEFSFYTTLLKYTNPSIDTRLLHSVLKTIKQNPELTNEIFDSFSENQFQEKIKLFESIENLDILNVDSEVIIFGSWFGSILIPLLSPKVRKITAIDLDDNAIKIAKNRFFSDYTNIDYISSDIFSQDKERYHTAKLFINTSCEHMQPMNTWPFWRYTNKEAYFAFMSNNMRYIEGHVNCVDSIEEFKIQLPHHFTYLHEDKIEEERGTKFLLIGKINC